MSSSQDTATNSSAPRRVLGPGPSSQPAASHWQGGDTRGMPNRAGQVAQQRRRVGVAVERCHRSDVADVDARREGAPVGQARRDSASRRASLRHRATTCSGRRHAARATNHPVGWGTFGGQPARTSSWRSTMGSVVKYDRTLFEPEHDLFRESYRAFLDRARRAVPRAVGEGQDRRPRRLAGSRQAGLSRHGGARGVRRRRQPGLPLQRDHHRGDRRGSLQRDRLRPAQRRRRAVPAAAGQRGAEAALAAAVLHRRNHHRDRDDRAGHRQRPAGHQDPGGQRGRPLRAQRRRRRSSPTASTPIW